MNRFTKKSLICHAFDMFLFYFDFDKECVYCDFDLDSPNEPFSRLYVAICSLLLNVLFRLKSYFVQEE